MFKSTLFKFCYFGAVLFLGAIFFTSGMGKLFFGHNYLGIIGPVWLADELAKYGLKLYGQFIGLSQIVIGFSLLTLRFRVLGLVMLVPMLMNILMVTISLKWQGTPFVVGGLLLVNIFLLMSERVHFQHLMTGIKGENERLKPRSWQGTLIWLLGLFITILSVFVSYYFLVLAWNLSVVGIIISLSSGWIEKRWINLNTSTKSVEV